MPSAILSYKTINYNYIGIVVVVVAIAICLIVFRGRNKYFENKV